MTAINFQPIFEYFDIKFDDLSQRITNVDNKVAVLQTSVDSLAKSVKYFGEELLVVNTRLEKLEAKI